MILRLPLLTSMHVSSRFSMKWALTTLNSSTGWFNRAYSSWVLSIKLCQLLGNQSLWVSADLSFGALQIPLYILTTSFHVIPFPFLSRQQKMAGITALSSVFQHHHNGTWYFLNWIIHPMNNPLGIGDVNPNLLISFQKANVEAIAEFLGHNNQIFEIINNYLLSNWAVTEKTSAVSTKSYLIRSRIPTL